MSDFDELLDRLSDRLGRNTVSFVVERVFVRWSVSVEQGSVDERLEISLDVSTEPRDDELKSFTDRYLDGSITLMPLHGRHETNDQGRPIVGVLLPQQGDTLSIRILVEPTYLTALATLVSKAAGTRITVKIWPYNTYGSGVGKRLLRSAIRKSISVPFGSKSVHRTFVHSMPGTHRYSLAVVGTWAANETVEKV
jgi:hypothetical protein